MPEVIIAKDEVLDQEDLQAEVAIGSTDIGKQILTKTLKNGFRAFISFYGQAWDAALDTHIQTYLTVDGNIPHPRFQRTKVQTAAPEQPQNELVPWFEVSQGSTIAVLADNDSTGATGNVTARVKIYYTAFKIQNPGGTYK